MPGRVLGAPTSAVLPTDRIGAVASSRQASASPQPMLRGERTREPGQVAGRRLRPPVRVAELHLEVDEESGQRSDVLVVVTDDLDQLVRHPAPQEPQVASGDLRAVDVADPVEPEELCLGGPQPGVVHPVPEQSPDDRQQVEVAGVRRSGPTGEPDSGPPAAASRSHGRCR